MCCCLLAFVWTAQAQKSTFDDVLSVQLQNIGPIVESNTVKGYYMFYKVDKVDRKNNSYMLKILDENLRDVALKKIIKPKNVVLTEAVYNGEAFLFSFLDPRAKSLNLVTYNREMKKLGSKTIKLDKWSMTQYQSYANSSGGAAEASSNKVIHPIGNKGFVRYTTVKNKKAGYVVEYMPNDLKKTSGGWSFASSKESKMYHFAGYAYSDDNYLLSVIINKPKLLSNKNVLFALEMTDAKTGKKIFRKDLKIGRNIYSFMNAILHQDGKSLMVFGEYFNADGNILKDRSEGLSCLQFDFEGNLINKEHYSWKGKIKRELPTDKKGRVVDGGYVAFHKFVQTSDGHVFAIGEMYKKAVSGLGIASQALTRGGGGMAAMKMVVLDMVLFDINPDLTLNDVTIFEKRKSDVGLPQGAGIQPPTLLSYYIRAFGGFDYNFTQVTKDKSSFFTTYSAIEKKKKSKKKPYFAIISHTEGDEGYVTDKIDLTTDATNIMVFPAKPGYIMLAEYFKKKKKLETRLEKINY